MNSTTTTCSVYTYYGPKTATGSGTLQYTSAVTQPHYSVRLIMWVILVDQWSPTLDKVIVTNSDTGASAFQNITTASTS